MVRLASRLPSSDNDNNLAGSQARSLSSSGSRYMSFCELYFLSKSWPTSNSNTWMPCRFRKARTRTTYVLLAVNIVLYSISVLHWILNSVVVLGIVSMGRVATLILIEGLPVINVRVSCAS